MVKTGIEDTRHRKVYTRPLNFQRTQRSSSLLFMLAAAAFLYLRTFLISGVPFIAFGDEVHYFLHAVRMLHGEQPYRDFFTFVFPGTDLLYEGIFGIFGIHQWVAQAIILVLGLMVTGVVIWVSSTVLPGGLSLLPALLFLVFDFQSAMDATHHWWSTLCVLFASGLLLRSRSRGTIIAVGALCALATLFTQNEGGLSLAAIVLYLTLTRRNDQHALTLTREISLLIVPYLLLVGGVIGYLASKVGLHTIFYWTIYFPLVYFSTLKAHTPSAYFQQMPTFHRFGDIYFSVSYLVVHLVAPFSYVLCLVRLIRMKGKMEPLLWERVFLIALLGCAMFLSVANAATFLRICVVAPPAFIMLVWMFSTTTRQDRWVRGGLWTVGVCCLLYLPITWQTHKRAYVDTPTGRAAFIVPSQYDKVQWLAARTHPGETLLNEPFVAFALSLRSPGPVDYVMPSQFTRPEQVDALLKSMVANQTRFIYLYPELYESTNADDNLGPLRQYMASNYHLARKNLTGQWWELNSSSPTSKAAAN